MQRRKLEELNLIDDFLLYHMVSHPEFGEEFTRDLLRIILGKEVGKLTIIPQKVYYGTDTDKHGARLDVYIEEEAPQDATIFDLEPEREEKEISLKSLPRRARFYHSKIDASSLQAGVDYQVLKNVIVIFIMPKDPFGANRMVYTIQKGCVELPEFPYDDGAKTMFLYTKGTEGNIKEELRELLQYMEKSCEENAKSEMLKKIHQMTNRIKSDREVSIEYMKIYEREQMIKNSGIAQGHKEEATRNAHNFFVNGVSYEIVRASIPLLTDEELQEIYESVNKEA